MVKGRGKGRKKAGKKAKAAKAKAPSDAPPSEDAAGLFGAPEDPNKRNIGEVTGFFDKIDLTTNEIAEYASGIHGLDHAQQNYVKEELAALASLNSKQIDEKYEEMLINGIATVAMVREEMLAHTEGMDAKLKEYRDNLVKKFDDTSEQFKASLQRLTKKKGVGLGSIVRQICAQAKAVSAYKANPIAGLEKIDRTHDVLVSFETGLQHLLSGAEKGSFYLPERIDTRQISAEERQNSSHLDWPASVYALSELCQKLFMQDKQAQAVANAENRASDAESNQQGAEAKARNAVNAFIMISRDKFNPNLNQN